MTVSTIDDRPFTLNVFSSRFGCPDVETETYANATDAIHAADKAGQADGVVHCTVTDERTGEELFEVLCYSPDIGEG